MIVNKKLLFNIILTLAVFLILLSGLIIFCSKTIISDVFLDKSREQLSLIRDLKQQELERFFLNVKKQVKILSKEQIISNAFKDLKFAFEHIAIVNNNDDLKLDYLNPTINQYYNNLAKNYAEYFSNNREIIRDKVDFASLLQGLSQHSINLQTKYITNVNNNSIILDYVNTHDNYHEYLNKIIGDYKYNDLLLVDLHGNVIYSVKKNIDFASSIASNNFINSEISSLFNSIKYSLEQDPEPLISNVSEYFADYQEPVFFVANKIPDLGVLIVSLKLSSIENLIKLPEEYKKTSIYLVDQDLRLIAQDNFGKILHTAATRASLNAKQGSIEGLGKDKLMNISYFTPIKDTNLNLVVETRKAVLLESLIKPLVSMFYLTMGGIPLGLLLVYILGCINVEKTDKKISKIGDFMRTTIAKKDLSSRISMHNEELPSNIADILNNMLAWFQNILDQVVFKIKQFVEKYNSLLSNVTIVSEHLHKEQLFFDNAKDATNQLEVNIFKVQHECQQYYNIINENKNIFSNFTDLGLNLDPGQNTAHLSCALEYIFNICRLAETLCIQISLEGHKFHRSKNKNFLLLFKQIKQMAGGLKSKLVYIKNSLDNYAIEHNSIRNFVNDFSEKIKPINSNINRLLEVQKNLLLVSNEQLNNVNKLQKELLDLELKYNNLDQQLLEIVNNNSKLNSEILIDEDENVPLQVVESKSS